MWREVLGGTGYGAGCPVLAVAIEETDSASAAPAAAAKAFATWQAQLADSLQAAGVGHARSDEMAALVVAAVEGTVVMCRATRSSAPLDKFAHVLTTLIGSAVRDALTAPAHHEGM